MPEGGAVNSDTNTLPDRRRENDGARPDPGSGFLHAEDEVDEVDEFGLKIKPGRARSFSNNTVGNLSTGNPVAAKHESVQEGVTPGPTKHENESYGDTIPATSSSAQESSMTQPPRLSDPKEAAPYVTIPDSGPTDNKDPTTPTEEHLTLATHDVPRQTSLTSASPESKRQGVSEWSHMALTSNPTEEVQEDDGDWQDMPAYATHTIYDDWGKVLAREEAELVEEERVGYNTLGGAGKGYTKVQLDEDAQSATSLDEDTSYLFKQGKTTTLLEEDEEGRDATAQMQATKDILTEGQRIAYVGVVKIAGMDMYHEFGKIERTRATKKGLESSQEALRKWGQKIMVKLYAHMEIDSAEQLMIEQLAEHGVQADDLTPTLMQNARVKNPMKDADAEGRSPVESAGEEKNSREPMSGQKGLADANSAIAEGPPSIPNTPGEAPLPYDEDIAPDDMSVKSIGEIANLKKLDIDLRWTVLCDLFLLLIADSAYDARSRTLLEYVGKALSVEWMDICRFEKRITDALEMQEAADKENWNEEDHMQKREKAARNRKLLMMGLATVGGGLVIGLSAGLLAPVIGAGFAAGFTTLGVAGTGTFFGGAGAAALITSTGVVTGSTIGVRASSRRFGAVKTFEYRPLHNNKRVNLIVTVAGWMTGKVDDVRLPFSTIDPIMGDIYSVFWEPEMLQSMGQTINILATEALTQGLQQILGSTILITLMAALQLPIVLTKLAYLIDNPWNVSLARADQAGLILADSLMDRNLGSRPITLCGFSIGARVIFACLKELAKKGQHGLIQNVYLYGSPMVANKDDYIRARSVVSGRFLNGYATNDWILGYLFRATSGGIMRVAGLAPVEITGIENVDVTAHVPGHMSYRTAMPALMQKAGWAVESLEFNEIEDPDPDNHEKRQRELINEIEEARKQLETKPEKKGLKAFFSRGGSKTEKKEWETYDERAKAPIESKEKDPVDDGNPVLFDVEAIMKEVAELAAQGVEVKEIQSTLPPMKLDLKHSAQNSMSTYDTYDSFRRSNDITPPGPSKQRPSFNGHLSHRSSNSSLNGGKSNGHARASSAGCHSRTPSHGYVSGPGSTVSLPRSNGRTSGRSSPGMTGGPSGLLTPKSPPTKKSWWRRNSRDESPANEEPSMSFEIDDRPGPYAANSTEGHRPALRKATTEPLKGSSLSKSAVTGTAAFGAGLGAGLAVGATAIDIDQNAWADEDEFGNRINGEMEMTFE